VGIFAFNPSSAEEDKSSVSAPSALTGSGTASSSTLPGYTSSFHAASQPAAPSRAAEPAPPVHAEPSSATKQTDVYGYDQADPPTRAFLDRVMGQYSQVGYDDIHIYNKDYVNGAWDVLEKNALEDGFYLVFEPNQPPGLFIVDQKGTGQEPRSVENSRVLSAQLAWSKIDEKTREVIGEDLRYLQDPNMANLQNWTDLLLKFQPSQTMFVRIAGDPDLFTVDMMEDPENGQLWPYVVEAVPGTPFVVKAAADPEFDFFENPMPAQFEGDDEESCAMFNVPQILTP
jgi:hypothetical protein